jgi:hypothetical protein
MTNYPVEIRLAPLMYFPDGKEQQEKWNKTSTARVFPCRYLDYSMLGIFGQGKNS